MSLSTVMTRALCGVESPLVCVETHLFNGLPSFTVVGLPETAVRESRERVRCAIVNSGFEFPMRRVTVNLAPADLPKEGGRFDLAIALGVLVASGQLDASKTQAVEFIAELGLSGECCSVKGILSSLVASEESADKIFVATDDAYYGRLLRSEKIRAAPDLLTLLRHLREPEQYPLPVLDNQESVTAFSHPLPPDLDFVQVKGQYSAKRALEIAAAGGHNLLFYGPPGTGKSMLASRIISVLPRLTLDEARSVASLYTLTSTPRLESDWYQPPFRSPHHSSSAVALVGGGAKPRPGEVSLAHHGILFLGHPSIPCTDSPQQIEQYRRKLSGPFLDRIDMHLEVPFQSARVTLASNKKEETGAEILARVERAREIQRSRQSCLNTELRGEALTEACDLTDEQNDWLIATIDSLALSSRAAHRVLRLARTLADCSGDQRIAQGHLAQALRYRPVRAANKS